MILIVFGCHPFVNLKRFPMSLRIQLTSFIFIIAFKRRLRFSLLELHILHAQMIPIINLLLSIYNVETMKMNICFLFIFRLKQILTSEHMTLFISHTSTLLVFVLFWMPADSHPGFWYFFFLINHLLWADELNTVLNCVRILFQFINCSLSGNIGESMPLLVSIQERKQKLFLYK